MNNYKHDDRYKKNHGLSREGKMILLLGGAGFFFLFLLIIILVWKGPGPSDRDKKGPSAKDKTESVRPPSTRHRWPDDQEEGTTEDFFYRPKEEETTEEDLLTEEDFYEALKKMGRKIQDYGLAYNGNAGHKTFEGAGDFNCALFVSWTLQEMKLIPSGKTFWFDHKGHGSGYKYMEKHKERFEIYHPNCPITASALLKPGDICGMKINGYAPHTAVYAGRDSKGRMLWYSAGRTDFRKMAKKGFQPIRFKYYEQNNDILYTIVHIKFDEKKEGSL